MPIVRVVFSCMLLAGPLAGRVPENSDGLKAINFKLNGIEFASVFAIREKTGTPETNLKRITEAGDFNLQDY